MLFHLTGDIPDPSAIGPYVADEIALARQLEDEGVILFAVKRAGGPGVFLLIEAEDRVAAEAHMARLPFVEAGVMTLEYTEVVRV